jgi:hypothetical protein
MYVLFFQPDGSTKRDVSQHGIMKSCSALQKDRWWVQHKPRSLEALQPGSSPGLSWVLITCNMAVRHTATV